MPRAKPFFYVCVGVFLLALSYHLGARSAGAQVGGVVECAGFELATGAAVINHELWVAENTSPPRVTRQGGGPIPNPARAVACGYLGVVLENGQVWRCNNGFWEFSGSLPFSGPVEVVHGSWGQVKARYR